MRQPFITIGITCYNAEHTIERALDSALRQDWSSKEIIVVDDHSSDISWEIIRKSAEKNSIVRAFRQEINKGYPAALNRIIYEAKGSFISIFDDDDVSTSERISKQYARIIDYELRSSNLLVLCYTNRMVFRSESDLCPKTALAIGRKAPEPSGIKVADYIFDCFIDGHHVWGLFGSCTLMSRRETFLRMNGFDEQFRRSAEWDFAVRASFEGAAFIAVNEELVLQYKTPTADKSGQVPLEYALNLRHKHKNYLKGRRLYLGSILMTYSRFFGFRKQFLKSRLYRFASLFFMPPEVLFDFARRKFRWR